jgi:geranylgeranyl diphosphate synthase type I
MDNKYQVLADELERCRQQVKNFLLQDKFRTLFFPQTLQDGVLSYLMRMGKAMRPALVMWAAGAVSDDERVQHALPAAAAIELFHTYSIVHDDIIDRDDIRRGGPTVHAQFTEYARTQMQLESEEAQHFGVSMGLLAGDAQLCWCFALLADYVSNSAVSRDTAAQILQALTNKLFIIIPSGEVLDISFALTDPAELTKEQVLDMYYRKTAVTFEVAARVGALIGLNRSDHPYITHISEFARLSGLAFQLYDDLLGIIGNPRDTKKPVGADLHEGKRTFTIMHALENANSQQRTLLSSILGNRHTTSEQITQAVNLLKDLGALEFTQLTAQQYLDAALQELANLPESRYRDWLSSWAGFIIERSG